MQVVVAPNEVAYAYDVLRAVHVRLGYWINGGASRTHSGGGNTRSMRRSDKHCDTASSFPRLVVGTVREQVLGWH